MSETIDGTSQTLGTPQDPAKAHLAQQPTQASKAKKTTTRKVTQLQDETLLAFAREQAIEDLSEPTLEKLLSAEPGYTLHRAKDFLIFQNRLNEELLSHAIITQNDYTQWFQSGTQTPKQMRDFVQQFSVFANLFLIAQLKKVINAPDIDSMRDGKEILMNELGVIYSPHHRTDMDCNTPATQLAHQHEDQRENEHHSTHDHYQTAHFEWLLKLCEPLNLQFTDLGKRKHGTESTLFFCDELERLYGDEEAQASIAAAYAVENWAAAGLTNRTSAQYGDNFWVQLVKGIEAYNDRTDTYLAPAYFTWHRNIAAQHARHTQEELEALYFELAIDEDRFIKVGNDMLQGVATFWTGLDNARKGL